MHTDSLILVGQLSQGWQVMAANRRSLVDEAAALIQTFGRCAPLAPPATSPIKAPRDELVLVLGHSTEQAEYQSDRPRVDRRTHPW
jgi:hypothetical protein